MQYVRFGQRVQQCLCLQCPKTPSTESSHDSSLCDPKPLEVSLDLLQKENAAPKLGPKSNSAQKSMVVAYSSLKAENNQRWEGDPWGMGGGTMSCDLPLEINIALQLINEGEGGWIMCSTCAKKIWMSMCSQAYLNVRHNISLFIVWARLIGIDIKKPWFLTLKPRASVKNLILGMVKSNLDALAPWALKSSESFLC